MLVGAESQPFVGLRGERLDDLRAPAATTSSQPGRWGCRHGGSRSAGARCRLRGVRGRARAARASSGQQRGGDQQGGDHAPPGRRVVGGSESADMAGPPAVVPVCVSRGSTRDAAVGLRGVRRCRRAVWSTGPAPRAGRRSGTAARSTSSRATPAATYAGTSSSDVTPAPKTSTGQQRRRTTVRTRRCAASRRPAVAGLGGRGGPARGRAARRSRAAAGSTAQSSEASVSVEPVGDAREPQRRRETQRDEAERAQRRAGGAAGREARGRRAARAATRPGRAARRTRRRRGDRRDDHQAHRDRTGAASWRSPASQRVATARRSR